MRKILAPILLAALLLGGCGQKEAAETEYLIDGKISRHALENYLARSVTYTLFDPSPQGEKAHAEALLDMGAKYVARAAAVWMTGAFELDRAQGYRETIDLAHESDPDMVFEACLFETTSWAVGEIKIPAFVFEAFGLPVEDRVFSYEAMLFPDGRYEDHWLEKLSVPDMTQTETQMFMYWHAAFYIDAGFEALHWGQIHLMGETDKDFAAWTKVVNMVRDYAKAHARRGFVIHNAHTHGIVGTDGRLLFDCHFFPSRPALPEGAFRHEPSEENPQETVLLQGHLDSIYGKSLGGQTHSGWSCESLPYAVELDNYGGISMISGMNRPGTPQWPWGYDEISWFANQPAPYRAQWLEYAYKRVMEFGDSGYLAMPGIRGVTLYDPQNPETPVVKTYYSIETGDSAVVKRLWAELAPAHSEKDGVR